MLHLCRAGVLKLRKYRSLAGSHQISNLSLFHYIQKKIRCIINSFIYHEFKCSSQKIAPIRI